MKLLCVFSVLILLAVAVEPAISSSHHQRRFESIFSFGASFADTGNGNIVSAVTSVPNPSALPPYGETFFGHPTARRCDGRLIIDFIAEKLGLPFLPPSLSHNSSFSQGANFAVLGSTALDAGFFRDMPVPPPNTSMGVQLGWFKSLKSSLCSPAKVCPRGFFDRSLFFMGEFGLNDYDSALLGKTLSQVRLIVPDVVKTIGEAIEGLIKLGATTVVVPGVPPVGCFPPVLEMHPSAVHEPRTGCLQEFNELAMHHNSLLQETLENIRANHLNALLIYADFFTPIIKIVESPRQFGFTQNVLSSCCGGGGEYNFNMSATCGMPGATICKHPNTYLFWDDHFTEATNHYIAKGWLNKLRMQSHLMGVTYPYSATAKDFA